MIDFNQASIAFKKYLQDYDLEYGKFAIIKIRVMNFFPNS